MSNHYAITGNQSFPALAGLTHNRTRRNSGPPLPPSPLSGFPPWGVYPGSTSPGWSHGYTHVRRPRHSHCRSRTPWQSSCIRRPCWNGSRPALRCILLLKEKNWLWSRRRITKLWRVFSVFVLSLREMPRRRALSTCPMAKTIGPRVCDPTTFNPLA